MNTIDIDFSDTQSDRDIEDVQADRAGGDLGQSNVSLRCFFQVAGRASRKWPRQGSRTTNTPLIRDNQPPFVYTVVRIQAIHTDITLLGPSDQGTAGWAGYSLPLITGAMSVKFEKETVRDTATVRPDGGFGPDGNVRSNGNFGATGNAGPNANIGANENIGPNGKMGPNANIRAESTTTRSDGNIRTNVPLKEGKQGFAHELGERLTGGEGTVGYLAVRHL